MRQKIWSYTTTELWILLSTALNYCVKKYHGVVKVTEVIWERICEIYCRSFLVRKATFVVQVFLEIPNTMFDYLKTKLLFFLDLKINPYFSTFFTFILFLQDIWQRRRWNQLTRGEPSHASMSQPWKQISASQLAEKKLWPAFLTCLLLILFLCKENSKLTSKMHISRRII